MEDLNVLMRGQSEPRLMPPVSLATSDAGNHQESPPPVALEASLRLAAALLDQYTDPGDVGDPVIDIYLGGYHWTVSRHVRVMPDVDPRLSPRELEIVRMVALGLTNRGIASALDISPWTVGTHLRRVFVKLEVNSRAAMVARVSELGLYLGMNGVPLGDPTA